MRWQSQAACVPEEPQAFTRLADHPRRPQSATTPLVSHAHAGVIPTHGLVLICRRQDGNGCSSRPAVVAAPVTLEAVQIETRSVKVELRGVAAEVREQESSLRRELALLREKIVQRMRTGAGTWHTAARVLSSWRLWTVCRSGAYTKSYMHICAIPAWQDKPAVTAEWVHLTPGATAGVLLWCLLLLLAQPADLASQPGSLRLPNRNASAGLYCCRYLQCLIVLCRLQDVTRLGLDQGPLDPRVPRLVRAGVCGHTAALRSERVWLGAGAALSHVHLDCVSCRVPCCHGCF